MMSMSRMLSNSVTLPEKEQPCCSPTLPVDVMLGQGERKRELPDYVQRVQQSLRAAFSSVHKHLDVAHQCQQQEADKLNTGEGQLQIGDRVWLYETGKTRKLAFLW